MSVLLAAAILNNLSLFVGVSREMGPNCNFRSSSGISHLLPRILEFSERRTLLNLRLSFL